MRFYAHRRLWRRGARIPGPIRTANELSNQSPTSVGYGIFISPYSHVVDYSGQRLSTSSPKSTLYFCLKCLVLLNLQKNHGSLQVTDDIGGRDWWS